MNVNINHKEALETLNSTISSLTNHRNLPHIVVTGDFNLPDIYWENDDIKSSPQYGMAINKQALDIANDNFLCQMTDQPTRHGNILDLVFSTRPDLVYRPTVHPGMSDHELVTTVIDVKPFAQRKPTRDIYMYSKADIPALKTEKAKQIPELVDGI